MLDPRKKPHVKIQPPFIRPDLSDRQITIKVSDNGIHNTIISSKVSFPQFDRALRCHFPFNSIMQLTYFQSLFSGGVTIFRFIPIVSCHKCVLCVSPVLFLVFHLNTGSDSRQHSQMSVWILKATCLQTNTQKTQIIQG